MLSKIKVFVKNHELDIIVSIFVVLVALISFGFGRITAPNQEASIIINNPSVVEKNQIDAITRENQTDEVAPEKTMEKSTIVASSGGTKYHHPDCTWAKKIKSENLVIFSSEAEAQAAGYTPCTNFK